MYPLEINRFYRVSFRLPLWIQTQGSSWHKNTSNDPVRYNHYLKQDVINLLNDLECEFKIIDPDGTPMLEINDDSKALIFKLTY
jgi:hypothetical protein